MHGLQQINKINSISTIKKDFTFNSKNYQVECDYYQNTIKCYKAKQLIFESSFGDYVGFNGGLSQYVENEVLS